MCYETHLPLTDLCVYDFVEVRHQQQTRMKCSRARYTGINWVYLRLCSTNAEASRLVPFLGGIMRTSCETLCLIAPVKTGFSADWTNRLRTQTGFNATGAEHCIFLVVVFPLWQIKVSARIMVQTDYMCS